MADELWKFSRSGKTTKAFGQEVPTLNAVRARKLNDPSEVVYTQPNNDNDTAHPYMPGLFPKGRCELIRIFREPKPSIFIGPVLFVFDVSCMVERWLLDKNGGYLKPSGEMVPDGHYCGHHARIPIDGKVVDSWTTWGCLNFWYGVSDWQDQINELADEAAHIFDTKNRIFLEVTD